MSRPLFSLRLATYLMVFAWGAISLSIGLNTVVKQNQLKSMLRRAAAPSGITLRLITNSVVQPAIAAEVFCVITALVGIAALVGLFVQRCNTKTILRLQACIFCFLTIALFATEVPVSYVVSKDSVIVYAWKNGTALDTQTILDFASSLNVDIRYRHIDFILWMGIIPWIAFLFVFIATVVDFVAASKAGSTSPAHAKEAEALGEHHDDAA